MDGSVSMSGRGRSAEEASADLNATIAGLKADLVHLQVAKREKERWAASRRLLGACRRDLDVLDDRASELREAAAEEKVRIAEVREEFAGYRIVYRKWLWSTAPGRHYDEIRTVGGKLYREVTLRSVSALELQIAHESGTATLAVAELPRELCDEYQLSPAAAQKELDAAEAARMERRQALEELRRAKSERELGKSRKRPATRPRPKGENQDPELAEEIASLRREAIELHTRLTALSAEIIEARMKASGNQRSPPGSLETWEQRAMRLARMEGRMVAHLTDVENRLWVLDRRYRLPIR